MPKSTAIDRLIDFAFATTYARLMAGETVLLTSIVAIIMAQRHLVPPLEHVAAVVTGLLLLASAAGGVLIGLRIERDLKLPVARHLKNEFSYHLLMGLALAMSPGALVGMFGDGMGLAAAFCGWAIFTVPLTALLMYEEARRFLSNKNPAPANDPTN